MLVIELHDSEVDDATQGTFNGSVGRQGTICYAYQAEMWMQDTEVMQLTWRRAYLKTGNRIKVVWTRQGDELCYLARTPDYDGEWVLPFVGAPDAAIAVGLWDSQVTAQNLRQWVAESLQTAITAVVLQNGDIHTAWELVDGQPTLMARGRGVDL